MHPEELSKWRFFTDNVVIDGSRECTYMRNQVFFASHVGEIAKAYAQAVEDNRENPCKETADICDKWRELFNQWEGR